MSHSEAKTSIQQFETASDNEKMPISGVVPEFVDPSKEVGDIDLAAQALQGESLVFTPEEMNAVRTKIDWHIVPLAAWACGIQFVDKSGLGASATYGMRASLHLVGQDYSWCVTIFYFGYLLGACFSGRLLQRFHAGKVMGLAYIGWSATLLGMIGVKNYTGVLILRFLLGVLESAFVPGMLLVTTMWYNQSEQPFRFGLWTVTNGLMPIPFLLIYYDNHTELPPWRLIFLVIGLVSFVTGVLLFFFMPDNPTSVSWLNHREKAIAVERVAEGQTGIKNTHFKWEQAKEAFTDYRVLILVAMMFTCQAIGSVTTNFLGIVINGFGYSPLKTQLFSIPNSALQAVTQILISAPPTFIPFFRNSKQLLMSLVMCFALVGVVILYQVTPHPDNKQLRLGACILLAFSGGNYSMVMATIGTNIAGFTKKQVTTSFAFSAYCVINIITPQTFLGRESPRYHTGLGFVMGMCATFIVLCWVSTFLMNKENRRRDEMALTNAAYTRGSDNVDLLSGLRDHTDKTNFHMRYSA